MKKNLFFIILIAIAAFSIAAVGAWFSVYGLTKIFPAGLLTFILFGALEFAKLVVVSFVYRFWKITKFFQRIYLIFATTVLMAITSMGIYGFLTNSYQSTSNQLEISNKQISILQMKRDRYQQEYVEYSAEKESLNQTVTNLTKGLSNNQVQYVDKQTGQLVTSTSSETRKALEGQLIEVKNRRTAIYNRTEALSDSIAKYDMQILDLKSTDIAGAEIGPLKYLAKLTNMEMDRIVNWLSLLIIFVFDPLAVILIISLNQLMVFSGFDPFAKTKSYQKLQIIKEPNNEPSITSSETTSTTVPETTSTTVPKKTSTVVPETTSTAVPETTSTPVQKIPTTAISKTAELSPINFEKLESNHTTTLTTTETPRLNNTIETTTLKIKENPDNLISYGKNQDTLELKKPGDP